MKERKPVELSSDVKTNLYGIKTKNPRLKSFNDAVDFLIRFYNKYASIDEGNPYIEVSRDTQVGINKWRNRLGLNTEEDVVITVLNHFADDYNNKEKVVEVESSG